MLSKASILSLLILSLIIPFKLKGQAFILHGTVYDFDNRQPLEAVSVFCSCGNNTITDSMGKYDIRVNTKDSIWFSYFGKNTLKYSLDTISNTGNFEIGLHVNVPWLPEVKVRNKSYRQDSLQNRQDYSKIFNYKKPGLKLSSNPPSAYVPGSMTVGLDLDELINVFRFKRNRQLLSFQQRLIQEEQDKYIEHRFSKRFIMQLIKIKVTDLDSFTVYYKPKYEELLLMNDLELGYYIQQSFKQYMMVKRKQH